MQGPFYLEPIGRVIHDNGRVWIEISPEFEPGLLGLGDFSHIHVMYWFHENDTAEKRKTLRVRPRKNPDNPLTGVFATHSPMRPNLVALTLCKIEKIEANRIFLDKIDARNLSPVIDIKPYFPKNPAPSDVRLPGWA